MAQAERLRDNDGTVGGGNIVHRNVLYAAFREFVRQNFSSFFRVAIDRTESDEHALFFGGIGAPVLIFVEDVAQIVAPDKTVQRADHGNFQAGRLFEQRLYLRAVFAHDVGVIAAEFIDIIAFDVHFVGKQVAVNGAECTKGIGGEQDLIGRIIGDHGFGPVDHRRHYKRERVAAGRKACRLP